ncbi:MAG: hypothetical protein PF590_00660 [Candidatus Delongbacteria bacterium]|nr:hypothetical protein [Candidatus Delongbacteria bacterium]
MFHKNNTAYLVIITLIIAYVVYWIAFDFMRWDTFDEPSFIGGARMIFGLEGAFDFQSRITKPLVLLLPGFMEWAFNIHPKITFILQNSVLFFLTGWFMYKSLWLIYREKQLAFLGFLAFIMCQSYAIYALMVLSDAAGWFFIVIGIYLSLKYVSSTNKIRMGIIIALLMALGIFAKESAVIGMIFFLSILMTENNAFKHKIKNVFAYGLIFIICTATIFAAVHLQFGDNIIARVHETHLATKNDSFHISKLWQLYSVLDVFWMLFFAGVLWFLRSHKKINNRFTATGLIALLISTGLLLLMPYFVDRILFIIAPLLIILVTYGLIPFSNISRIVLVVGGGIINILVAWLRYRHHIPVIEYGMLMYGLLIASLAMLPVNRKRILALLSRTSGAF